MSRLIAIGAFLALLFGFVASMPPVPPVQAASSGSDESQGAESGAANEWRSAKQAIAVKDYAVAIPLLIKVVAIDPKNANAFNYLGYAHAHAGKNEAAVGYYQQALALKADHRGANEYLGELYLKMNKLAAAEARLKVLDESCFFGCPEFDLLQKAIDDYKATGKFSSQKGL